MKNIYSNIYNHTDHSNAKHTDITLKENAKIIDVSHQVVGNRKAGTASYRTTVTFDDGFQYIAHTTNRETHFGSYTLSITPEDERRIKSKAISVHNRKRWEQDNEL